MPADVAAAPNAKQPFTAGQEGETREGGDRALPAGKLPAAYLAFQTMTVPLASPVATRLPSVLTTAQVMTALWPEKVLDLPRVFRSQTRATRSLPTVTAKGTEVAHAAAVISAACPLPLKRRHACPGVENDNVGAAASDNPVPASIEGEGRNDGRCLLDDQAGTVHLAR